MALNKLFQNPYFFLVIVLIGVGFKFHGLESKFFWLDEIFTMSHTTGIEWNTFIKEVPQDSVMALEDFNALLNVNSGKYLIKDQFKGLLNMPQVTPLHYFILVPWTKLFGGAPISYRLFSFFVFLLALPAIYWLTILLTEAKIKGWMAMSLLSVSPFFQYYALEARYYTLWLLLIILVHTSFLKSLEKNNLEWWALYGLVAIALVYTSAISGLILVGHFVFVLLHHRSHLKPFFICGTVVGLLYLPWIMVMLDYSSEIMASTSWQEGKPISLLTLLGGFLFGLASIFFASNSVADGWASFAYWNEPGGKMDTFIHAFIVLGIFFSLIYLYRNASKRIFSFILIQLVLFLLYFIVFDVVESRSISMVHRYHVATMVMAVLAMSYFLGDLIIKKSMFSMLGLFFLLGLGIYQCHRISTDPCFWNVFNCQEQMLVTEQLDQAEKPLLIAEPNSAFTFFVWETILPVTNKNLDILLNPKPDRLTRHVTGKAYSDIYFLENTFFDQNMNGTKYASIRNYQEGSWSNVPVPIFIDRYAIAKIKNTDSMISEFMLDIDQEVVTSKVTIIYSPEEKIGIDSLFLAGNHYSIGNWNPGHARFNRTDSQRWALTTSIEQGEELMFKLTQGSWLNELGDPDGVNNPPFSLLVERDTTIVIKAAKWTIH